MFNVYNKSCWSPPPCKILMAQLTGQPMPGIRKLFYLFWFPPVPNLFQTSGRVYLGEKLLYLYRFSANATKPFLDIAYIFSFLVIRLPKTKFWFLLIKYQSTGAAFSMHSDSWPMIRSSVILIQPCLDIPVRSPRKVFMWIMGNNIHQIKVSQTCSCSILITTSPAPELPF